MKYRIKQTAPDRFIVQELITEYATSRDFKMRLPVRENWIDIETKDPLDSKFKALIKIKQLKSKEDKEVDFDTPKYFDEKGKGLRPNTSSEIPERI